MIRKYDILKLLVIFFLLSTFFVGCLKPSNIKKSAKTKNHKVSKNSSYKQVEKSKEYQEFKTEFIKKKAEEISSFNEELEKYSGLIINNPKNPTLYFNRGVLYSDHNNFEKAEKDFVKAIKLNSNYADAYLSVGLVYLKTGRPYKAQKYLENAIKINPGSGKTNLLMGDYYLAVKKYDKAVDYYEKAKRLLMKADEPLFNYYLKTARLYEAKGNFQEETKRYKLAIKEKGDLTSAHLMLAKLYLRQEKLKNLKTEVDIVLSNEPFNYEAHTLDGSFFLLHCKYQQALESYKKAILINPQYILPYENTAMILLFNNNRKEAITILNKAIELDPKKPSLFYYRGIAYSMLKNESKARKDFEEAVKLDSKRFFGRASSRALNLLSRGGTPSLKKPDYFDFMGK